MIKHLFSVNRSGTMANSVVSYDFDTLYTSLPHDELKSVFADIVRDGFSKSKKKYIRATVNSANFSDSDKKYGSTLILKEEDLLELFEYLIDNAYINFKGKVFRQYIGIPMGIDPAPFIANLFLHDYEYKYIKGLINSGDLTLARKLRGTYRYLDDLIAINDEGVFDSSKDLIYPCELRLSRTDRAGIAADYLDLDIYIKDDVYFKSKLFDKRDNFPFKVINYPCLTYSNIPDLPSYGIFLSQVIRICRLTTDISDFQFALKKITKEFLNKGFNKIKLISSFKKFILYYSADWGKLGVEPVLPDNLLPLNLP